MSELASVDETQIPPEMRVIKTGISQLSWIKSGKTTPNMTDELFVPEVFIVDFENLKEGTVLK